MDENFKIRFVKKIGKEGKDMQMTQNTDKQIFLTLHIEYFRPNSIRQRLAELRLDSKSRGGGDDETL